MENFRVAVKAFIVSDGNVLLLRRRSNDVHKPGTWDIPGGRLEIGEDPYVGLKREVHEEAGIEVEIHMPLDVHHFVRDDGQTITMIVFWCTPKTTEVVLSEEHQEFAWQDVDNVEAFPEWIQPVRERFEQHVFSKSVV